MNATDYGLFPPPPTGRPPAGHPPTGAPAAPGAQGVGFQQPVAPPQRRPVLPTITTSLVTAHPPRPGSQHALGQTPVTATPITAINMSSPYSTFSPASALSSATVLSRGSSPMAHHPPSGLPVAYNPQEWNNRNGQVAGQYRPATQLVERPRSISGMEAALPTPPPPYSPSGQSPAMSSAAFAATQTASPSALSPDHSRPASMISMAPAPSMVHRVHASPAPPQAPSFPPPPPGRDRSTSRNRLWGLSSLSRHRSTDSNVPQSAIESLSQNTSEALARTPSSGPYMPPYTQSPHPDRDNSPAFNLPAPASRRSASTGALHAVTPMRQRVVEQDTSPNNNSAWEPGMPLPPPPPGPPPPTARSQSLGRVSERSYSSSQESLISAQGPSVVPTPMVAPRRRAAQPSTLGPVPPTPAGWVDESRSRSRSPAVMGLHIDTSSHTTNNTGYRDDPQSSSQATSAGGLGRSYPKREPSARGIRERRSESRAARERSVEGRSTAEALNSAVDHETARPADLVLNGVRASDLNRRKAVKLASPRSNRFSQSFESLPDADKGKKPYGELNTAPSSASNNSRPSIGRNVTSPEMPTPPFSPATESADGYYRSSPAVPPKTLPTPPPQRHSEEYLKTTTLTASQSPQRPISHILHTPNEDTSTPALQPSSRPSSAGVSVPTPRPFDQEAFGRLALERHQAFIERENAATSDQDRLEIFAQYIVTESRLRRDRYSAAFDFMAGDIMDLTRDLWKSYGSGRRSATPTAASVPLPEETSRASSQLDQYSNMRSSAASPASSRTNFTPRSEPPESPSSVASMERPREKTWSSYQPCLSPILSMKTSTINDDGYAESRGRSASRWWEQSADGSQGRPGGKTQRSKRESKFMGLAREERFNLQWTDEPSPRSHAGGSASGPSSNELPNYPAYGANEYPAEKVGLHEEREPTPSGPPPLSARSVPQTPDPNRLDISRLITLPPPYPRHYPAVNNNHPDLAQTRNNHRSLLEMDDARATKEWFSTRLRAKRDQRKKEADERRLQLRTNIQQNIQSGIMTYANAAAAEAQFEERERQLAQSEAKAEFDMFQADVFTPLNALFSERVTKAAALFDQLSNSLDTNSQLRASNEPQEEGDEQPELLEKLTLLKWLFEARETAHKELFNLESERNERYKTVVLTPYHLAGMTNKVNEVQAFFEKDAMESASTYENTALKRYESFNSIIESNVTRGVEDQLSAFWDIAPGLLATIQKVPDDLASAVRSGWTISVPASEYEENPAYHDFPLQYLYTLLTHAGKSAYQHIEAQTNLLCLLHEVKSASLAANSRYLTAQRCAVGEPKDIVETEMADVRKLEDARLTDDLRDRVGVVENQWSEALGDGLNACKGQVEEFLHLVGGWDESLNE